MHPLLSAASRVARRSWATALLLLGACDPPTLSFPRPSDCLPRDASVYYPDGRLAGADPLATSRDNYEVPFRPCASDADCIRGTRCDLRFPRGLCTEPCSTHAHCGWNGLCVDGVCHRRCGQFEFACDDFGGACGSVEPGNLALRVCRPQCAPPAVPCSAGLRCNTARGTCGPSGSTPFRVGERCDSVTPCEGVCLLRWGDLAFLDGACVTLARRPSDATFVTHQPLPYAGCPEGANLAPLDTDEEGDTTPCLPSCLSDANCRSGYHCARTFARTGAASFSNGVCLPPAS